MTRTPLPRPPAAAVLRVTRVALLASVALLVLVMQIAGPAAQAAPKATGTTAPEAAAKSAAARSAALRSAAAAKSAAQLAYAARVGRSPSVPNPDPPLGGLGPNGHDVGGAALRRRGVIVPADTPALPAQLTAKAWMVTDLDTGAVLAARDPHGRYQPASVLKLLAGLVLLPRLPGARVITATPAAANAEGSAVGLVPGGRYPVDTLFKSLFLESGNDAAMALSLAAGGPARTVADMSEQARRLGAYDTVVQTPSGLDGWTQLTSAYDLTLILRAALNSPRLVAYDEARTARLPAQQVGKRKWGAVPLFNESDNFLDTVPGALLVKTGYTGAARHTYVCAAARGGRRIGVVFLRNERRPLDQYQQAGALLSWAFSLPRTTPPVGQLGQMAPAVAAGPTVTSPAGAEPSGTAANGSRTAPVTPAAKHRRSTSWASGPVRGTVAVLCALSLLLRLSGRWRRRRIRRHR